MGISGRLVSTTGYALLAATIFAQSALAEPLRHHQGTGTAARWVDAQRKVCGRVRKAERRDLHG